MEKILGIDFRKKNQRVGNIYVWKEKDGFGVGINGTSQHFKVDKNSLKTKIEELKCSPDYRN